MGFVKLFGTNYLKKVSSFYGFWQRVPQCRRSIRKCPVPVGYSPSVRDLQQIPLGGAEYIDWLKKQSVSQFLTVVMSCGCRSFPKPVKNPVLYCSILLYICSQYLDTAMRYLDITKSSWLVTLVIESCPTPLFCCVCYACYLRMNQFVSLNSVSQQ